MQPYGQGCVSQRVYDFMMCVEKRGIKRNVLEQSVSKSAGGGSVGLPFLVDLAVAAEQVEATLSQEQTVPTEGDQAIIDVCERFAAVTPDGPETAEAAPPAGQTTKVGDLNVELQTCTRVAGDVVCRFALSGEFDLGVVLGVGGSEMMGGCTPSEARDEEGRVLRPVSGELAGSAKAGHCLYYELVPGTRPKMSLVFPEVPKSLNKLVRIAVSVHVSRKRTGAAESGMAVFGDVPVR